MKIGLNIIGYVVKFFFIRIKYLMFGRDVGFGELIVVGFKYYINFF